MATLSCTQLSLTLLLFPLGNLPKPNKNGFGQTRFEYMPMEKWI